MRARTAVQTMHLITALAWKFVEVLVVAGDKSEHSKFAFFGGYAMVRSRLVGPAD